MSDHRHGSVTAEAPRNDYGSGVFFPAPTLAISAPYSAPKQQSVFETAGSREDAEKEKDRQRKAADAERVATLLEFDVEFEHAVLYRSLQFAFDDVNPAPALDLTAGSDLIKGNWQTHIGAMVGKETASAVAESLIQRRIKEFAALRESEDGPGVDTRMAIGKELGRISRFRENAYFGELCTHMETRLAAGDHGAVKACLRRLGKMKVSSNRLPPGTYGEHGEFISFEGDPALLSRGYRDYLEQHFAADEFENDRPEWAELETSTEDLQQQGPTDKELRVVWGALKSGKAAGADDCPREAYETASEALDDFLYLVAACIHQQRFPPMVALVMFVLLHKAAGTYVT